MESALLIPAPLSRKGHSSPWIHSRPWDVGWLIGSSVIVPVVLLFVWAGASSVAINIGITALIGGPHLFSTYLATYMDPRFRRSHSGMLIGISLLVPAFVIYWTIVNFQVLLSVFIFAASLHVLQQNAYLTDIYRKRTGLEEPTWSRLIDYGLMMVCIYPIASYKLVHSSFMLGDIQILIPSFLMIPFTYWLVWVAFGFFFLSWLSKTVMEHRNGLLNRPKTLLIGVTTVIAFLVPMAASGTRLELAFQAVNAWHSIQYLGIIWYVQKVRKDRGLIDSHFVSRMSGSGRAAWYFYGFCFLTTAVLMGVLLGLYKADPFHLSFSQYYYMGVLSCLLIHYALDAYLFTVSHRQGTSIEHIPFAAPATA